MKSLNKKIVLFCGILISIMALCGCRLAQEDDPAAPENARLVGMYITTEHLDLFDFGAYFSDNAARLMSGKQAVIEDQNGKYGGRVYATKQNKPSINEETGEASEFEEYEFVGLEGYPFAIVRHTDEETGECYTATMLGSEINDGHFSMHVHDEGETNTLEGTIYVVPGVARVLYCNPVYQTADGRVYLEAGSGISCSSMAEGLQQSYEMKEDNTTTENGKTQKASIAAKLNFEGMNLPYQYVIVQMNANNEPLHREEYAPEELPKGISPVAGTDYLVIETHKTVEGKSIVKREFVGTDMQQFMAFAAQVNGVCLPSAVDVNWK